MIVAVDLFGRPADYDGLRQLADSYGLTLVADAAQSFGAAVGKRFVGTFADYTTVSFFPAKPLGCYGDGGAVMTDRDRAADRLRSLRIHGKGADKYDNVQVGLNSRLDTLQAAILMEKLAILRDEIVARNAAAERYDTLLRGAVQTPRIERSITSAWAQYTILLSEGADRSAVQSGCKAVGVPTAVYYPIPMHEQTGYAHFPADPRGLVHAESICRRVLSLPMHPYLDAIAQERVATALLYAIAS
jgi:dTDP-4-amino-4,6-dideoxygalactose transaminase